MQINTDLPPLHCLWLRLKRILKKINWLGKNQVSIRVGLTSDAHLAHSDLSHSCQASGKVQFMLGMMILRRVSAAMLNKENDHLNRGFCLPIFPPAAPFASKPREAGTSGGSPCPWPQLPLESSLLPFSSSASPSWQLQPPKMGERNDDIAGRISDCLFSFCSHLLPIYIFYRKGMRRGKQRRCSENQSDTMQ